MMSNAVVRLVDCRTVQLFILIMIGACAGATPPVHRSAQLHLFTPRLVVLEVVCDGCLVSFAVGGQDEEVAVHGMWSHRFTVRYSEGRVALTVVPSSRNASISCAGITIGGETVAEGSAGPGERVDLYADLRPAVAPPRSTRRGTARACSA